MDIISYFHPEQWLLLPIIPLITYLLNRTLSKLELLLLCGALLVTISPIIFGYQIRSLWVEFLMYLAFSAVVIGLLFRTLSDKYKGFLGFLSVILLIPTFIAIFFSSFGATTTVVSSYQKDGYLYQKKYVQGFAGQPVTYLQQNETFLFGFYIEPLKRIDLNSTNK